MTTYQITARELFDYLLKGKPFNPKRMKLKYKGVYCPTPREIGRNKEWRARIVVEGEKYDQYYESERAAALAIDKFLIRHGRKPVNILK